MAKEHYSQLLALVAIARERSFTRAAAQLGMSQSMLSHTIRAMESRLGVRLLTRTTRSVAVTETGERLLASVIPRLASIEARLQAVSELGDTASGTLRITASDHAIDSVLWPRLAPLLKLHPRLNLEMHCDYALADIVQGRFDFGVRVGDSLSKDTCALPITESFDLAIIGTPEYFAHRLPPQTPDDLLTHECINLRLPTRDHLYTWELGQGEQPVNVRVTGRLVFNGVYPILNAALDGHGLAYVPLDLARPHLTSGRAVPVLAPWWRSFPGYHLYYAAQRQTSRAMQVVIDALRLPHNA